MTKKKKILNGIIFLVGLIVFLFYYFEDNADMEAKEQEQDVSAEKSTDSIFDRLPSISSTFPFCCPWVKTMAFARVKVDSVESIDCSDSISFEESFPWTAVVDNLVNSFLEAVVLGRLVLGSVLFAVSSFCSEGMVS